MTVDPNWNLYRVTRTLERITGLVDQDDLADALLTIPALRFAVDDLVVTLVAQLRARGESWATIGSLVGTTRQAAHERFGPHVEAGRALQTPAATPAAATPTPAATPAPAAS